MNNFMLITYKALKNQLLMFIYIVENFVKLCQQ